LCPPAWDHNLLALTTVGALVSLVNLKKFNEADVLSAAAVIFSMGEAEGN
jgi:hypothetical protein